ncbi:MAG TPA: hypothetical protein VGA32_02075 [Anaerolineales bacterium]
MFELFHRLEGVGLAASALPAVHTTRYRIHGEEHLTALRADRPVLVAAWHGQTHLLVGFMRRRLGAARLRFIIPDDERGIALGTGGRLLGFQPFKISMKEESFGAARSTLSLIRSLGPGDVAYINPDGPYGPARVPKDGVAFIAARASAQLLPVGAYTGTCYRLRRWDRYSVPLPFSRITVVVRPAFTPDRDEPRTSILDRLTRELTQAIEEAERLHRLREP